MQEPILYRSRCDNRLNEIAERVCADKREVETLAKKYKDKYKQSGDVASKSTVEEATFRDILEKKMELCRAIVKLEQEGSADKIQVHAGRIQLDLDEPVKSLNECCKTYGLHAKPTTLVELPFACSHAGLVDEGLCYFYTMVNNYRIQPTTAEYSCLIDLLGRSGRLREAYGILLKSPSVREDIDLLSTLLSACRMHGESDLGEEIATLLIQRDPDDPSTYIILANMYASDKLWNEARKVRLKMKELGLKKNPSCSWIEIDGIIKPFLVEEKSTPQAEMVYRCLSMLISHVKKGELLKHYYQAPHVLSESAAIGEEF